MNGIAWSANVAWSAIAPPALHPRTLPPRRLTHPHPHEDLERTTKGTRKGLATLERSRRVLYRAAMSIARIREAIVAGVSGEELATIPLPEFARGALVLAQDTDMFE